MPTDRPTDPDLNTLQAAIHEWSLRNFPEQTYVQSFLGVVEEVGELSHAILKEQQGLPLAQSARVDAVGDIVIFLMEFCSRSGLDFADCVRETWETVSRRERKAWGANR